MRLDFSFYVFGLVLFWNNSVYARPHEKSDFYDKTLSGKITFVAQDNSSTECKFTSKFKQFLVNKWKLFDCKDDNGEVVKLDPRFSNGSFDFIVDLKGNVQISLMKNEVNFNSELAQYVLFFEFPSFFVEEKKFNFNLYSDFLKVALLRDSTSSMTEAGSQVRFLEAASGVSTSSKVLAQARVKSAQKQAEAMETLSELTVTSRNLILGNHDIYLKLGYQIKATLHFE